jgi:HK97 family phage major capsid protein
MEIKEMQVSDIECRMSEIENLMNAEDADVEALSAEVDALIERKNQIKAAAEEKRSLKEKVAGMKTEPVETIREEGESNNMMDVKEYRNTKEYIDAFARYVKTGDDKECRELLTENVGTGTVVVPALVENYINTAWQNDEILNRVRKTFIKGNLKVNFEISGTDAVLHVEGSGEVTEEELALGKVTIVPANVKKWISISDEVYEMGGEAFLDYIYDEITYRIVKKLAALIVAAILASPATSSASAPGVAVLTQALGAGTVVAAEALLSAEATEPVAIMNRATWGALKAIQITSGQNVGDVFNGLPVVFTDALDAYADASAGEAYMIVGDLKGVTVNFPAGDDVKFKFDDLTAATEDMIRVIGRVYAGLAVTAPYRFAQVKKPS